MNATNDPSPTASRIDALIAQMTPAEKAGQLTQYFCFGSFAGGADAEPGSIESTMAQLPTMVEGVVSSGGATSLLFVTDPAEVNRLQRLAVEDTRLGIPLLFGFDVIHGLRTILPVPIAMAASWDPELRALKRRLSDVVFRALLTDQQPAAAICIAQAA